MAKISATEIKNGILIEYEGRLWRVVKARHVHVGGRGGAYMQVEVKDIATGAKNSVRLRTDEKVDRPYVEQRRMRFLYAADDEYMVMDEENFDQVALTADLLDGRERFLLPDTLVDVNVHEGRVIGVVLPSSVVLTVTHTDPQVKGATASASYKPAETETGITVMVPPFIGTGEKIRVNVDSGEYLERAD